MSPLDDAPPTEPLTVPVTDSGRFRRLAQRLEFDRAVFYVLVARGWQTISGPITVILIATHFSPELQGYYYTFGSLLAAQSLFELNLGVVLVIAAGRESSSFEIDAAGRLTGESAAADRVAALARFGRRWYAIAALLCWVGIGGTGLWLFRSLPAAGLAAWLVTATAAAVMVYYLSGLFILQGCRQIESVNQNYAFQSFCSSLAVWAFILAGTGLWAVAATWIVKVAWDAWLIRGRYGTFFRSLQERNAPRIRWTTEVWPLQWRLAIQTVATAAATSSFVLALFTLGFKTEGGRMGMTLSVLNMILWSGLAWVQTRVPVLAAHSRHNNRTAYDKLFWRVMFSTTIVVATGALAAWLLIFMLRFLEISIANRFVGTTAFALLAAAIVTQHVLNCLTIYARTRQREPFVVPTVLLNLAIAIAVWLAVPRFVELGVATAYASLLIGLGVPIWIFIWRVERDAWRAPTPAGP